MDLLKEILIQKEMFKRTTGIEASFIVCHSITIKKLPRYSRIPKDALISTVFGLQIFRTKDLSENEFKIG